MVTVETLADQIASLSVFVQALGGIIFLYIVFNSINVWINRKKKKEIESINKRLKKIEGLLSEKKKK